MSMVLPRPMIAPAQVAGSTLVGVAPPEMREDTLGWSAKRNVLGQALFNDRAERVGTRDDIVIAPNKAVSYVFINAGDFLGVAKHDVAILVSQLTQVDGKSVLAISKTCVAQPQRLVIEEDFDADKPAARECSCRGGNLEAGGLVRTKPNNAG